MARPRVRDKILQAARLLLEEQGPESLKTRAIAERAGVTEASLYNNFGDKRALIRALFEQEGSELRAYLEVVSRGEGEFSSEERRLWLQELLVTAYAFYRLSLPLAGAHMSVAAKSSPEVASFDSYSPLVALLARLKASGALLQNSDEEAVAVLILGASMHAALNELSQGNHPLASSPSPWQQRIADSLQHYFP